MAVAPLPSVATSASNTAQAGPRVVPVGNAAPVAQGGGQRGAGAQTGANAAQGSQQGSQLSAQQAAAMVKQVTTQALLTLMQSLGKPLQGTTTGTTPQLPNSSGPTLNVQVHVPTSGSQPAGQLAQNLAASLPLPKGSAVPLPGTPVSISAETTAGGPRLAVTVQGQAAPSPESLRADAARQGSLAPLMADIAKLSGQPGVSKAVDAAIGKLMGFSIDGEVTGNTLRNAVDGARGMPQSAPLTSTGSQGGMPASAQPGVPAGAQSALGALIRALGFAMPDASAQSDKGNAQLQTQSQQAAGQKTTVPNLPADAKHPTKAPALPLPADAPDMANTAQMQALRTNAEAALSRLNLLQSRMQDGGTQAARGEGPPAIRWDVPLMIGQEAALLGVAIERDGSASGSDQDRHLHWRFRFAFQSTRHGEVEGMVALHQTIENEGSEVDVAVWAQKPGVLATLEATRADLVAKLEALGVHTNSLTIAPIEAAPHPQIKETDTSRHLVDVRS